MRLLLVLVLGVAACGLSFPSAEVRLFVRGPRVASARTSIDLTVLARTGDAVDAPDLDEITIAGATGCRVAVTPAGNVAKLKATAAQPGPCLFTVTARTVDRFVRQDVSLDFLDVDLLLPAARLPAGCLPSGPTSRMDDLGWIEIGDATYCGSQATGLERIQGGTTHHLDEQLRGQLDDEHVLTCGPSRCFVRQASGAVMASVPAPDERGTVQVQRGTPTRIVVIQQKNGQIRIDRWHWEDGALAAEEPVSLASEAYETQVWRNMLVTREPRELSLLSLPSGDPLVMLDARNQAQTCDNHLLIGSDTFRTVRLAATVEDVRTGSGLVLGAKLPSVGIDDVLCSLPGVGLLAEVDRASEDGTLPALVKLWDTAEDTPRLVAVGSLESASLRGVHPRGVVIATRTGELFLERRRIP